jgi:hypothetical protein
MMVLTGINRRSIGSSGGLFGTDNERSGLINAGNV